MPSGSTSQPPPALPSVVWHIADLYSAYILPRLPDPVQSLSNNVSPVLASVVSAATSGDLVSLAAFLLAVYLALKIADYIRRSVIGWVVLLAKLALALAAVNCAFYVRRHGWQQALGDAEWIVGLVWGFVEDRVINAAAGDGTDNRTGWYGGGGGGGGAAQGYGAYGGGRQQVPVARGRPKGKSGYGWT